MSIHAKILCTLAAASFAALLAAPPAQALTTQECSAKYQAAKAAGTLNGEKWNDFRKAQCGADCRGDARRGPGCRASGAERGGSQSQETAPPQRRRRPEMRYSRPPSIRNIQRKPPARPACTPASINTTPTKPPTAMAA